MLITRRVNSIKKGVGKKIVQDYFTALQLQKSEMMRAPKGVMAASIVKSYLACLDHAPNLSFLFLLKQPYRFLFTQLLLSC